MIKLTISHIIGRYGLLGLFGALFAAPIGMALYTMISAGLGYFPALGHMPLNLDAIKTLLAQPGLATSISLSLFQAFTATLLSLILACLIFAHFPYMMAGFAPILAIPHVSIGLGLAFLIAPTGWLARWPALLLGWQAPPNWAVPHDTLGLSLILALAIKEIPFFMLMLAGNARPDFISHNMTIGHSLGYDRLSVWLKIILPQTYPNIRLPVYITLAFSLSVVDVNILLGPTHPPNLALLLHRWFTAPSLDHILPANAGAALLLCLTLGGLLLWRGLELLAQKAGRIWLVRGRRARWPAIIGRPFAFLGLAFMACAWLSLLMLALWSLAFRWPFPDLWPLSFTGQGWRLSSWLMPFLHTLICALAGTACALSCAVLWLEGEDRHILPRRRITPILMALPLLIPQISLIYGLNIFFIKAGLAYTWAAMIWVHGLFIFPYLMLTLTGPWRALDPAMMASAAALGAGPWRRLFRVKLPLLRAPLCSAIALGIAVSCAQFLPTLFIGGGRITGLASETIALGTGTDRRAAAAQGVLLALLPLLAYGIALLSMRKRRFAPKGPKYA